MNSLPNPNGFKNFKASFSSRLQFDDTKSKHDLEKIIEALKKNPIPQGYISKIFDERILKHNPRVQKILKKYFNYSKMDDSLTITLKDGDKIKTIVIHRTIDEDGNLTKWKTVGSKKHIHINVKDNFVFCVYGMKEIVLCELLEMSYMAFQSDSITKSLHRNEQFQNEIKSKLDDKYLILLLDNDSSCRSTINPIKEELKVVVKEIIPIEMQDLWNNHILTNGGRDRTLPKGYDFTDFANDVKDVSMIENNLKELIKWSI